METLRGKHSLRIDGICLRQRLTDYSSCLVDLGTGDGRFVRHLALAHPDCFVIGIDANREPLHITSRRATPNEFYLIANALALPPELDEIATHVTINFPWGSLLAGLLDDSAPLLPRLRALAHPGATLELRLNGGALAELGSSLEEGAARVRRNVRAADFDLQPPLTLDAAALHACPTTWAKRLAFGRDPRALLLRGALRAPSWTAAAASSLPLSSPSVCLSCHAVADAPRSG